MNLGINEDDRVAVVEGLSRLLADSYVLYLQTHGYHWNVTGPHFQALHTLFQGQYTELWNALDQIAERIRALDAWAPASGAAFARLTSITTPDELPDATGMLRALLASQEAVIRTARAALPAAERAGDPVTVDLLTQRLQVHEKTAWMLRAHLR